MILTKAIEQLRTLANSPFALIQGAEELEALAKGTPPKHGTVFVVPHQERAEPNSRMSGGVLQRVEVRFVAAVVIRQAGDALGAKRIEASDQFAAALERAFAGWCWDESASPAEFDSARAQALGNGVTLYAQTWRTDRYIEA